MKIADVMSPHAAACRTDESLHRAAELMWSHDCGCLPVVDEAGRPVGMITDRDICMAAWSRGQPLQDIHVVAAMSPHVVTCATDDTIEVAQQCLRDHQVRRLPVVDASGRLAGILSLADIVQAADRQPASRRTASGKELLATYAAVSRPRAGAGEPATVLPATAPSAKSKAARKAQPGRTGASSAAKRTTGRS